jgi:hypothetical protein
MQDGKIRKLEHKPKWFDVLANFFVMLELLPHPAEEQLVEARLEISSKIRDS